MSTSATKCIQNCEIVTICMAVVAPVCVFHVRHEKRRCQRCRAHIVLGFGVVSNCSKCESIGHTLHPIKRITGLFVHRRWYECEAATAEQTDSVFACKRIQRFRLINLLFIARAAPHSLRIDERTHSFSSFTRAATKKNHTRTRWTQYKTMQWMIARDEWCWHWIQTNSKNEKR